MTLKHTEIPDISIGLQKPFSFTPVKPAVFSFCWYRSLRCWFTSALCHQPQWCFGLHYTKERLMVDQHCSTGIQLPVLQSTCQWNTSDVPHASRAAAARQRDTPVRTDICHQTTSGMPSSTFQSLCDQLSDPTNLPHLVSECELCFQWPALISSWIIFSICCIFTQHHPRVIPLSQLLAVSPRTPRS